VHQRHLIYLLIFITLISVSLACKASSTTEITGTPGEILFLDDFSDPTSGWNRNTEPSGITDYDDGVYRILVNETNTDIWAKPGLDFGDVTIEVDAFKVGGDRDNRFGLICRAIEKDQFYTFIISSDGYYGIGKIKGQQYSLIGMESLQPSDAIELGSAINHIRADCIGDTLTLYINGQMVTEVSDLDYPIGDVGLIAGTYNSAGTDIRFDNFIVRVP